MGRQRRRNIAEKVAAGGAAAVIGKGARRVDAQPVSARLAKRIDTLHGQAGQVLHYFTSEATKPGQWCGEHCRTAAHTRLAKPS